MARRLVQRDVLAEQVPHSGAWVLSATTDDGAHHRKTYYGYSKRDALSRFVDEVNAGDDDLDKIRTRMKVNPGVRDLGAYASYHALATYLGKKDARSLAHNTMVVRVDDQFIGVILHHTRIVTFDLDGNVTLNSGGYHTVTTKQRINQFLRPHGWSVEQKRYEWTVRGPRGEKLDFEDGIVIPLGSTVHPSNLGYQRNPSQRGVSQRPSPDDAYPDPGKFEGETMLAVEMYEAAMESGADEEGGDSEGPGYFWLFTDFVASDGTPRHGILSENSQGFISLTEFDTATDAAEEWEDEIEPMLDEYFDGEGE